MMKIDNFRGDLTDNSTKKITTAFRLQCAQRCTRAGCGSTYDISVRSPQKLFIYIVFIYLFTGSKDLKTTIYLILKTKSLWTTCGFV